MNCLAKYGQASDRTNSDDKQLHAESVDDPAIEGSYRPGMSVNLHSAG